MGLLSEPECRAALILGQYHVDAGAVRQRFPRLVTLDTPQPARGGHFSRDMRQSLDAVERLLVDYPPGFELATEHLLLGLVAAENDVSRWLAECGLYADALEAEIHRLSGHQPGPLPLDFDEAPALVRMPASRVTTIDSDVPWNESERLATVRILDAAANRAGEGLRVIEDYLRFALDDRHLTGLCKAIRHELTESLAFLPAHERHTARDTQADVGTTVSTAAEQVRTNPAAVVTASFKRVEQALRSLEEYAKTQLPEAAAKLEQLRYRTYTLERAVDLTAASLERLADARLYVLIDGCESAEAFAKRAESLVAAGVSILQLRDKQLADRELLARARQLRELTNGTGTLFIMNDRPDLAALAGADGVHVGQEELTAKDARRIVGTQALVGVSTHSIEQARAAVLDGADYIGVGPTFPSSTKPFESFTGTELLKEVYAEIRLPAFAIGGISLENLPQVLATGFTRVAVSGAVTGTKDAAEAARAIAALLNR